jgi:Zn-dependent peptidase ImmA (M78 family)/transcriptional regulator with XRE-family HTH domain
MEAKFKIRPEVLGGRLKSARTVARLTQDSAAQALGFARTTLAAIEAGKRQINLEELRAFAELYSVGEGALLSEGRKELDIEVKFRSSKAFEDGGADQLVAASLLSQLASSSLEIEQMLGYTTVLQDMPLLRVNRDIPLDQQAEDAALAVRQRIGIGLGPVPDIEAIMESEFNIRMFDRALPSSVSGAVAFDDANGAFVLVNSKHPLERRRQTVAHELCHALLRRVGLSVTLSDEDLDSREERFCDLFGLAFLMPAVAVRKKASELKSLSGKFSVRHLLMMSIYFCVSIEAMGRRLEALGLAPRGLYASLKEKGLGLRHLNEVRKEIGAEPKAARFTPRTLILAGAAYDRELLSEQQIASKLSLDLVTVRKILEQVSSLEDDELGFDF